MFLYTFKTLQYGLAFIKLYSSDEIKADEKEVILHSYDCCFYEVLI